MSDIDWKAVAQTMAADNARLCGRLLTAEDIVTYCRNVVECGRPEANAILRKLLDKHDAGRAS